jgi:hypothetical protein
MMAFLKHALSAVLPECITAPTNIVVWWPGDGTAIDVIGGNNGTLENGATYAAGEVGEAFDFTSTNEAVLIPYSPSADLSAMSSWTIEAWIKPASYNNSTWPTIYAKGRWDASLGLNSGTGKLESWINNANQLIGATAVSLGQWNHVALVYDGASRTFYVNGVFAGAGNAPAISPDTNPSAIGNVVSNNMASFNGLIDELSIYNRALSSNEVNSIYLAGSYGKCLPPSTSFGFDTSTSGLQWTPGGLLLTLNGLSGQGFVVVYTSTNLVSWTPIYTNLSTTGSIQFLDSSATNSRFRFYRAIQQ